MKAQRLMSLGLALAAMLAAQAPARAEHDWRGSWNHWNSTADGRLVDVQVQVGGRVMPLYFAPGRGDRHYFEALRGRNYALVVRNNTRERVGVLIAVDGLNVVNGELSSLGHGEPMYVLDPYETATIRGWRTSLSDVRRFVFVDEERSYAERTGQSNSDLGWVRVLAFRERRPVWRIPWEGRPELRGRERDDQWESRGELQREQAPQGAAPEGKGQAAPAPGAQELRKSAPDDSRSMAEARDVAPPSEQTTPGTGWGERRHDPVTPTVFEAEGRPVDHLVLRYEYASGLRALGIFPRGTRDRLREREGDLGFAKPPRW